MTKTLSLSLMFLSIDAASFSIGDIDMNQVMRCQNIALRNTHIDLNPSRCDFSDFNCLMKEADVMMTNFQKSYTAMKNTRQWRSNGCQDWMIQSASSSPEDKIEELESRIDDLESELSNYR